MIYCQTTSTNVQSEQGEISCNRGKGEKQGENMKKKRESERKRWKKKKPFKTERKLIKERKLEINVACFSLV